MPLISLSLLIIGTMLVTISVQLSAILRALKPVQPAVHRDAVMVARIASAIDLAVLKMRRGEYSERP